MTLTDHDEFLHLGYPKNNDDPWKENFYYNFIDRDANAMGIIHCSIQRQKGVATIRTHQMLDDKQFHHVQEIPWPTDNNALLNEKLLITDGDTLALK